LEIIRQHYPGLKASQASVVNAFGVNSQNWKISTGRDAFILKRVARAKAKTLERQADWVRRLTASGFPTTRFYPDRKKALVCLRGPYAWCLTYFEKGSYLGNSPKRWGRLLSSERRLAAYCVKNSPKDLGRRAGSRDFFTSQEAALMRRLRRFPKGTGLRRAQTEYVVAKYDLLRSVYLMDQKKLRRAVFHVDIHPLNVLFRGDRLSLLADFDSFRMTTLEISLGFSVFKCARELLAGSTGAAFKKRLVGLEKIFRGKMAGYSLADLLIYGQMDVLKRLLYVTGEMLERGNSRWRFMLGTQFSGLMEIDAMLGSLALRKTAP